jgi:hypothetical protein
VIRCVVASGGRLLAHPAGTIQRVARGNGSRSPFRRRKRSRLRAPLTCFLMFNTDRPTKAPLDVNELIREVITLVHDEIESQRVSVRTELANELPRVPANLVQLRQVMMNLVTNAVDAMHAVTDRHRVLRIKTGIYERSHLIITAEDSERGSIRRTSTASSSRSLQRNPTECVWGCRFAGRSSQITAGVWRWPTVSPMDRSFWYFYPEVHRSEDDERVGCFR